MFRVDLVDTFQRGVNESVLDMNDNGMLQIGASKFEFENFKTI